MSDSKIQIKVGIVEFSGEGNQDWLASQLDKIIEKIPELLRIELAVPQKNQNEKNNVGENKIEIKTPNFSTWLKDKNATTNQTRKFLATAAFLQANGKQRISTSEVTELLKKYSQNRLGNASESLNQNVGKGHCEKDGKTFYVTPEGMDELGVTLQ
jgi:hypothetical protein